MRTQIVKGLCLLGAVAILISNRTSAWPQDSRNSRTDAPKVETVKATYSVTGLHCAACAATLEGSLRKTKGVKSIKVNFKSKSAAVAFDESLISAQEVALSLAATPHMMGRDMQYGGALVLSVAGLKDKAGAQTAKDALAKVEGVSKVTPSPKQGTVSIEFLDSGKATTKQLIEALGEAGLKASQHGSRGASATGASLPAGADEGVTANGLGNHKGMRMGAGEMAGTRMRGNGNMAGRARMSQRTGCGMAEMDMDDRDMEGVDDRDDSEPRPAIGRFAPPPRRYYSGRRIGSGGCECSR